MLDFVGAKDINVHNKRRYPRFPLERPLVLSMRPASSDKPIKATALNISPQGMLLSFQDSNVRPGEKLKFEAHPSLNSNEAFWGEVKWIKQSDNGQLSGIYINDTPSFFSYFLLKSLKKLRQPDPAFMQSMMDSFEESAFLLDRELKIVCINKNQHLVPLASYEAVGKKISEVPSILKLLMKKGDITSKDILAVLYTHEEKFFKGIEITQLVRGEKCKYVFNISIKPVFYENSIGFLLVLVKDVTNLYKLRENIKEREKLYREQYRFISMGLVVDELLEDILNPLAATVGRIDLLNMKMANYRNKKPDAQVIDNWMNELQIVDGLLEQITRYCMLAAKRREIAKRGLIQNRVPVQELITETLEIVKIHSYFSDINIDYYVEDNLPDIKGEFNDWVNMLKALLQVVGRGMNAQTHKEIFIQCQRTSNGDVLLSIKHNARALKLPLEDEPGLAIMEYIQKKYGMEIELTGSSGSQQILLKIKSASSNS